MAFAQQQRRVVNKHQNSFTSDDLSSVQSDDSSITNLLILPTHTSSNTQSDSDWNVINSSITSAASSVRSATSVALTPSGSESYSLFRQSDSESYSDIDGALFINDPDYSTLPFHDGTGTFVQDDNLSPGAAIAADQNSFTQTIQQLLLEQTSQEEEEEEEEGNSISLRKPRLDKWDSNDEELPNILLPHGGMRPPSFISKSMKVVNDTPPSFVPTTAGFVLKNESSSGESSDVQFKGDRRSVITKKKRSLDSIPLHHQSGIPSSSPSSAIMSIVWNNLKKLGQHILENDTNTAETWGTLMSEAAVEGCFPFGSHLHMEINTGIRTSYQNSILESSF